MCCHDLSPKVTGEHGQSQKRYPAKEHDSRRGLAKSVRQDRLAMLKMWSDPVAQWRRELLPYWALRNMLCGTQQG
jgi:hypothetical protein